MNIESTQVITYWLIKKTLCPWWVSLTLGLFYIIILMDLVKGAAPWVIIPRVHAWSSEWPCVFMFERIYSQHSGTRLNSGFFYNSEFRFSAAMLMSCQCLSWVLLREISIQYIMVKGWKNIIKWCVKLKQDEENASYENIRRNIVRFYNQNLICCPWNFLSA